ncbi:MAG: septum formation protein Maf, partial [Elusimicrobia bacterium]|nr:septum formation protein Maf [Elusimicrobiota bacterium]
MKPQLILASKSERRVKLLTRAGIKFRQIVANTNEDTLLKRPSAIVKELSLRKAMAVAKKYPHLPVLGSDTLVFRKGEILGKPKNIKEAIAMLKFQNGNWQSVYSGIALVWLDKNIYLKDYDMSECKARKLGSQELRYFAAKHMDKAGGYAIQDTDDVFIEKIKGRFDTIVGLPINLVRKYIKRIEKCTK